MLEEQALERDIGWSVPHPVSAGRHKS